ncbi:MAG: hypothetical protein HQL50_13000, partial [Magnetococcales bacterium]|nr:hypothetical protein [Magnetococcales bacterium]
MRQIVKRSLLNLSLVVISVVISLFFGELVLRYLEGYALFRVRLHAIQTHDPDGTTAHGEAERGGVHQRLHTFLEQLDVPEGVDRTWFNQSLPPPQRKPSLEQLDRDMSQLQGGHVLGKMYRRIWNRNFVRQTYSQTRNINFEKRYYDRFPSHFYVFDPGSEVTAPRYRLFPNDPRAENSLENEGFVTNNYGYRGPDLSLRKGANVIRLAFLGGSTTVSSSSKSYSWPEYTTFYFNRWAESKGLDVQFEVVNTAREAFKSWEMAQVVSQELLPLRPDLVLYMEGANQFFLAFHDLLEFQNPVKKYFALKYKFTVENAILHRKGIFAYSVLAKRIAMLQVDTSSRALKESNKPDYTLNFPASVNERKPDVDNPDLPLDLPRIIGDLDHIKEALQGIGATFAVSSFIWLAEEGMTLQAPQHRAIHWYLNGSDMTWPLRYGDLKRLSDFQNRVFKAYTEAHSLPFVDVAREYPLDPDLFDDGIHK